MIFDLFGTVVRSFTGEWLAPELRSRWEAEGLARNLGEVTPERCLGRLGVAGAAPLLASATRRSGGL